MQQMGKKELIIAGAIVGLILAAIGSFWLKAQQSSLSLPLPPTFVASASVQKSDGATTEPSSLLETVPSKPVEPKMIVYIVGAVRNPGIYELNMGARLADGVNAAGGFSDEADREAVNLAMPMADGARYALPRIGETGVASNIEVAVTPNSGAKDKPKININSADQALLETLPNIGPSRARAIIDYRERKGPFRSIEELKQVSGIGTSIFTQLEELITCE